MRIALIAAALALAFSAPALAAKAKAPKAHLPAERLHVAGDAAWPVFGGMARKSFAARLRPSAGDPRLARIRAAVSRHEASKPPGWADLVERARSARERGGEKAMLREANALINAVPYVDGTDGSYMSPAELFARGGVCKDHATAKYLLLRDAGFPEERMRFAALPPRQPENPWHVVLIAQPARGAEPLVLDLKPAYVAQQELAKAGTTRKRIVERIREGGLPEVAKGSSSAGFYQAASYPGRLRGLAWVGNAKGSASFGARSPLAAGCGAPFWRDPDDPGRFACHGPSGFWMAERSEGVSLARRIDFREASSLAPRPKAAEALPESLFPRSPVSPLFGENDAGFLNPLRYNDSALTRKDEQ